jgi:[protein-PII] uridylyltransferase
MAPFSDARPHVPDISQAVTEPEATVTRTVLHLLWDLKLQGRQLESLDRWRASALTKSDMTVRTAFLEARLIWGDQAIFDQAMKRFRAKIVSGTAAEFVAAKLAERDQRHRRMGDTRYVVEPNVKDGKGGLRGPPHALLDRQVRARVEEPRISFVSVFFSAESSRNSSGRSVSSGRPLPPAHGCGTRGGTARLSIIRSRSPSSCATLTGQGNPRWSGSCNSTSSTPRRSATLPESSLHNSTNSLRRKGFASHFRRSAGRPKRSRVSFVDRGRLSIPCDDYLSEDPVRLLELYALAAREGLEIHPTADADRGPRRQADR